MPDDLILPQITACVQRLLAIYPDPQQLPHIANYMGIQPLTGFSHGLAGMVWALAQYQTIQPNESVKIWIRQALAYERRYFSKDENNWPDFRITTKDQEYAFGLAWCHGAPGIGLARADMPSRYHDAALTDEINAAVHATMQAGLLDSDTLCHGNLGNLELLLYLSLREQSPEIHAQYQQYCHTIIQKIITQGPNIRPQSYISSPGLMIGVAGIAYQLMRIARPKQVPSILLLKTA